MPIVPRDAWPADSKTNDLLTSQATGKRDLDVDGVTRRYDSLAFWPHMPVLCGLPSTSFPAGRSEAGLPIGLQAVGAAQTDLSVIDFVRLLMREMGTEEYRPPKGFE